MVTRDPSVTVITSSVLFPKRFLRISLPRELFSTSVGSVTVRTMRDSGIFLFLFCASAWSENTIMDRLLSDHTDSIVDNSALDKKILAG